MMKILSQLTQIQIYIWLNIKDIFLKMDPEEMNEKKRQRTELLNKIWKKKRQKDADTEFEALLSEKESEELLQAMQHNKFGGFCLAADKIEKAEKHLTTAKDIITGKWKIPATNIEMNLGNLQGQKKNYNQSIAHYEKVIKDSPYGENKNIELPESSPVDREKYRFFVYSGKLNSEEAYIDAHTNIAVMYIQIGEYDKAHEYCKRALELQPDNHESIVNFTDILRQLGKKDQAIKQTWSQIIDHTKKTKPDYQGFPAIQIKPWKPEKTINILSVKWGTRYPASYVNKLYASIKRNTTWSIKFYCFTDDSKDLHPDIVVKELEEGWKKWWGKVTLFKEHGIQGRKFYIDLDMVITGNLDELFNYGGQFSILRTGDLQCEKNHKDGYNSSVMIWNDDILIPVYQALKENFQNINKYIVRFDFWLEMTINNADYLQNLYPGQIVDFLGDAQEKLPEGARIVCFARKPKPEDYPAEWIREHWIQ